MKYFVDSERFNTPQEAALALDRWKEAALTKAIAALPAGTVATYGNKTLLITTGEIHELTS